MRSYESHSYKEAHHTSFCPESITITFARGFEQFLGPAFLTPKCLVTKNLARTSYNVTMVSSYYRDEKMSAAAATDIIASVRTAAGAFVDT